MQIIISADSRSVPEEVRQRHMNMLMHMLNKSVKYAILHREHLLSSLPVSLISEVHVDCCCFRTLTSTGIEIVGVLGRAQLQVSRI